MDYKEALLSVRDIFVNCPKRIEANQEELKKIEQEINDINHVIELTNLSASKGFEMYKELQRLQRARRRVKDDLEMLEPIKELLAFTKPTEKNINATIGKLGNVAGKHGARTYKMRVREDLQHMIK